MNVAERRQSVSLEYYQYSPPFDVLLVDDHKIMRDGIKAILERAGEFHVVGEAATGPDSLLLVKRLHPQIVLMDIGVPRSDGAETVAEILRSQPDCKILILSRNDDENSVMAAVRAGARAFILKTASDTELVEALRMVAGGGMYISPQVSDRLLARIQTGDLEPPPTSQAVGLLSRRERQVLRMVADGKTSKEVALLLDLREQTIRGYRKSLMKKLRINNVAGLTQLALQEGLTGSAPHTGNHSSSGVSGEIAAGTPGSLLRDSPWGPMEVADAHLQFFSHRGLSALIAQKPGLTWGAAGRQLGWQMPPERPESLAAAWIQEMDRQGVSASAVIASVPGDEVSVARAARAYPERLIPFAMVNPRNWRPEALAEIQVACLFPAMHLYSIQDACAQAVFEWAAEHNRAISVHCGALSADARARLGLPSLFDMHHANPIDLHAVALRYPTVPIIVPHLSAGYFREALMLVDQCPNVYLDTSSSNQWMRYQSAHIDLREVLRHALDVAGPSRLLFGTDSSYFPQGWDAAIFEDQARTLYEIGVSALDATQIFGKNLLRIVRGSTNPLAGRPGDFASGGRATQASPLHESGTM